MLTFEIDGHVAVITMNRPEARNAVDPALARAISGAVSRFETDPELWVAILTGQGPVFCAGADLKTIRAGAVHELHDSYGFAGLTTRTRSKPLIAAVNGPALAGGTEIVLSCDIVVASLNASFGIPEVKRSLVAAAGGLYKLPRRIPLNIAMEWALTGDPVSAQRAYGVGLVNALASDGQALAAARTFADRICANPPVAVRASRRVLIEQAGLNEAEALRLSELAFEEAFGSADGAEGLAAFIEKRPPVWTGS